MHRLISALGTLRHGAAIGALVLGIGASADLALAADPIAIRWNPALTREEFGVLSASTGAFTFRGVVGDLATWSGQSFVEGNTLYVLGWNAANNQRLYILNALTGASINAMNIGNTSSYYLGGRNAAGELIVIWWDGAVERFGVMNTSTGAVTNRGIVGDLLSWSGQSRMDGNTLYVFGNGPADAKNLYVLDTVAGTTLRTVNVGTTYSYYLAGVNSGGELIVIWWDGADERFGVMNTTTGVVTPRGVVGDLTGWSGQSLLDGNTLQVIGSNGATSKLYIYDSVTGAEVDTVDVGTTYNYYLAKRQPQGVPALLSPSGAISDTTPTFDWTDVAGATSYQVAVYDLNTGTYVISEVCTPSTYTPALGEELDSTHKYQWKVRSFDAGGANNYSSWTTFCYPPVAPVQNGPSGSVMDTTPTFSWNNVPDATGYQVAVFDITDNLFVISQVVNQGTYTYTPAAALDPAHSYKWRIRALNTACAAGSYSGYVNFTVTVPPLPSVPTPLTPTGGITDTTPTIDWTDAANADTYQVAVYDVNTASYPVSKVVGPSTYTLLAGEALDITHDYRFKVRSLNGAGASAYSAWKDFCYTATVPTQNGPSGVIVDTTPTFSWNPATNATGYQVAVYDNNTSTWVISQVVGQFTYSYTPVTPLDVTHTYQWRVRALDTTCAASAYSGYLNFSY
jgi:hypothetical protein